MTEDGATTGGRCVSLWVEAVGGGWRLHEGEWYCIKKSLG